MDVVPAFPLPPPHYRRFAEEQYSPEPPKIPATIRSFGEEVETTVVFEKPAPIGRESVDGIVDTFKELLASLDSADAPTAQTRLAALLEDLMTQINRWRSIEALLTLRKSLQDRIEAAHRLCSKLAL
jgi:hypothetical protein